MIVVVLDTNVWISALVLRGELRRFVELIEEGQLRAVISTPLIEEFCHVSLEKFHHAPDRVEYYRQVLLKFSPIVVPTETIDLLSHDPDNRVLECADAGNVDAIVTGDKKHLLSLGEFRGIPIVSPAEFLERFADYHG